ncbi:MAG: hypothetical protein K9J37_02460 [Saprospiraceae bacterium]|nr:hypothetical protein [Saprospiraceae bacterium]MCF8248742.1 hypothetical protein [Saprospiraceae bacterium]MCF8310568.1 hypothetical protein [Saprospiraceae bacterium]MCF8439127.1 hypothetical protein [Saprospiraceae bacterium]
MVFLSGKLIPAAEMRNPTIVVITDRNDLDDQLFDTFAASVQQSAIETLQAQGWAYVNGKGEETTHFPTFVKPTIISS